MGSEREVGLAGRNGKFKAETDGEGEAREDLEQNASQEWDPLPLLRQRPRELLGCRPGQASLKCANTRLDL